jgi:hypothetical protein
MTETQVRNVLKRALAKIEKGWTKGTYQASRKVDGKTIQTYCAVGAIQASTKNYDLMSEAEELVGSVIHKDVIGFNDAPTTRKRDVVSAFKQAIKKVSK